MGGVIDALSAFGVALDQNKIQQDITCRNSSKRCFVEVTDGSSFIAREEESALFVRRVALVEIVSGHWHAAMERFCAWADGRRMVGMSVWTPWFDLKENEVQFLEALGWQRMGGLWFRKRSS